jgi:eukaryotic-like serine/threonine-protein kinase
MTQHLHSSNDSVCEPGDFENTTPIPHRHESANAEEVIAGEPFGKYILVGDIAVGGMAEVFLGVQQGLAGFLKVVVIKRVLPHFTANEQFVRMFIDEARIAARLDHPNIVRTYEFGAAEGQYYTVMEYLPGEDLRSILRRLSHGKQRMPLHLAMGIVMQLCAGLHCAHQLTDTNGHPLNLVHRDVNPANIIITYGGEVKIIDFGVAKTNTTATVTGTIKGKIAYMPPEQILARGVDQRSDVFSAGVVLWELLTGRRLFGRASDAATLYAIMNDPVPTPSRYRPDVPRELDAIVMQALSRTPADRYHSADDMAAALEHFMASQPKFDSRVLGGMVEGLFGASRADAKKAISQTRSLRNNISIVMKLRSEVRAELGSIASGSTSNVATRPTGGPRRGRLLVAVGVMMAAIAGGVVYGATSSGDRKQAAVAAPAALVVESDPSGAAISIGGEPTGMKTPATLSGLAAKQISIRVELAGYTSIAQTVDVPRSGTISKRFTLESAAGRLALAELPRGAAVSVDGIDYQAGDVIEVLAGKHEVRVVVDGKQVVQQQLETRPGFQVWKLADGQLVSD